MESLAVVPGTCPPRPSPAWAHLPHHARPAVRVACHSLAGSPSSSHPGGAWDLDTVTHVCMHVKSLSRVQLFVTLWTVVRQAPLSMGFSRQACWSGFPLPTPGDLPDPGIEPVSLTSPALAGGFFTTSATWEACVVHTHLLVYMHTYVCTASYICGICTHVCVI